MADIVQPFAMVRQRRNPARSGYRNIQITQGEDITLNVTLWDRDTDVSPIDVSSFTPWLSIFRDAEGRLQSWGGSSTPDYGFGYRDNLIPVAKIAGSIPGPFGQVNFALSSAVTAPLGGRYWFVIQANSQASVSVLATGILEVIGCPRPAYPILVPAPGFPPGALGVWDVSKYNDGSVWR